MEMSRILQTLVAIAITAQVVAAETLDAQWTVVVGSHHLEQTAAEDLISAFAERHGVPLKGPLPASEFTAKTPAVFVGRVSDHPAIAAEHEARPFTLVADQPESYHAAYRGGNLYVVGQGPKGAMNGVYRLDDALRAAHSLDVSGIDSHGTPAFRYRIGDHLRVQKAPPEWSEIDQARYYARHYINVVWGEKFGPPLSYEARAKYGLGLMLEVTVPRLIDPKWMNDPANADAIYQFPHYGWMQKAVDPFHPAGRDIYLKTIRELLEKNPDTRILSTIVGDYSHVPRKNSTRLGDGKIYGRETRECIWELMGIMREAIGDRPIVPTFWLWHAFLPDTESFIKQLTHAGYGVFYNEAGDGDDWIYVLDNFNKTALKTGADGRSAFGKDFILLASAGGTCESTHPAVGLPLPRVAGHKMRRMADSGIESFALWWGSCEGWSYQANTEVVAEMIWNPQLFAVGEPALFDIESDSLLAHIAKRDFGDLAPDVLEFWRLMDEAMVDQIKVFSWFQRLGVFLVFWDAHAWHLDPASLAKHLENKEFRGLALREEAIENFGRAIERLEPAVAKVALIREGESIRAGAAQRLRSMEMNVRILRHTMIWQHNQMRAAKIVADHPDLPHESAEFRKLLRPIIERDIENTQDAIELLADFAPNFRLGKTANAATAREGEIDKLERKLAAMREYLAGE